jgi:hypothetical protein
MRKGFALRKGIVLALGAGILMLAGCHGMVDTYEERENRYAEILDRDLRQFADDWDAVWLADRQYRLTRWHVR